MDEVRRAAASEDQQERKQGYDETHFRDPRPIDGTQGAPSRERVLWSRYHDAREADEASDRPADERYAPDDSEDRDKGRRLTVEEFGEARRSLPEVHFPRKPGVGQRTTAHVFGEHGFLREDDSGSDNPDRTPDTRVGEALRMMDEDLGWDDRAARQTEKHVETKLVVDMIHGRLPKDIAIVINNRMCRGWLSCEQFIDERLPRGHTVRVYDYDGRQHFFEGKYEGTRG